MRKRKFLALLLAGILLANPLASSWTKAEGDQSPFKHDLPREWFENDKSSHEDLVRVIVESKDGANIERIKNQVKGYNKAKIRQEYDLVFKGFSAEISFLDIALIRQIPGVKNVSRTTEYYPTMATSKLLTQALEAAETYSNNGEGMVVSIIDSGLDLDHEAMKKLDDPKKAKIQDIMEYGKENKDTKFNIKVPYGYNFADKSYRIKGYESNHGMHVAGIVGANDDNSLVNQNKGIDGVASQAQLLAMKVFSNDKDQKGAQDDDIIAAIEASIKHKADIINLSLGSASGFSSPDAPMHRAINSAKERGVLVVAAAGNDTAAFADSKSGNNVRNLYDRKDIGIVGSPSTASGALSVASYENTGKFSYTFTYGNNTDKTLVDYSYSQGDIPAGPQSFVYAGLGEESDYKNLNVEGKIVLIKRGLITFTKKVINAKNKKAKGVVIFNDLPDADLGLGLDGAPKDIFVASIRLDEGEKIVEYLKSENTGFEFAEDVVLSENRSKSSMSYFSSIGTTNSLDFKPEISGIGGSVYSTDNDNKYVTMSGTSMASPHVAGVSAIVLSQVKKELPNLDNPIDFSIKSMLNTAKILYPTASDIPYTPRRQGAGLVQAKDAIENRVLASFEDEDGKAVGELRSFTGKKTFNVFLKNYGDRNILFKIKPGKVYSTINKDKNLTEIVSQASLSTPSNNIHLKPGQGKSVSFTLDASSVTDNFVEGFIEFVSQTEKQPSIHFSYMGFAGDWNKESVFDLLDVEENKGKTLYSDTGLITMIKDPLNIFDRGTILKLAKPLDENLKPKANEFAFSPNRDGYADIVLPQVGILRSLSNMEINILDDNQQLVKKLYGLSAVRRQSLADYLDRIKKEIPFLTNPLPEGLWDGTIYNKETGKNEIVKDGQYYYQLKGQLSKEYAYQELLIPIKVDTKKPVIKLIKDGSSDYKITNKGREVTFTATDETGLGHVYVKVNKERFKAEKIGEDTYRVLVPFSTNSSEKLTIVANDTALNEHRFEIKNLGGNSLQLTNWKPLVDKKIDSSGEYVNGITQNKDTSFISFKFVGQKDDSIVINSKDNRVRNGKIGFASFFLSDKQQGKYKAFAIEKNAQKEVIKETPLGDFVYDYTPPTLNFNYARIITDKNEQKNPLGSKSKYYKEYAMNLNPDGTATFKGSVKDNVFDPSELTLTIGSKENKVTINKDGTFEHKLKIPSAYFDFINLNQPGALDGQEGSSETIDGLDLAVKPTGNKKKGKGRVYTVTKYIPSNDKVGEKEFKLTLTRKYILGKSNVIENTNNPVREENGKYFFTLTGFTSQSTNSVFIDNEQASTNATVDDGLRFQKELEIIEGNNSFNVRVLSETNDILADVKVRVFFDQTLPSLELTSPSQDLFVTETKKDPDKENETTSITYIETYKDELTFAGSIFDNGFGYLLKINDDYVTSYTGKNVEGNAKHGDNKKEFSRTIKVKDGDIISLYMDDLNENKHEEVYVVRKIKEPEISLANISISQEAGVKSQLINNSDKSLVEEWTSEDKDFETTLATGSYSYKELEGPKGFEKINNFNFKVTEDGKLELEGENLIGISLDENKITITRSPIKPIEDTSDIEVPSSPNENQSKDMTNVRRIYGEDRLLTAISVSSSNFDKAETVIIARHDQYADALSSSLLAKLKNAPTLLNPTNDLDSRIEDEIKRLGAKNVIIIGGYSALSKEVENKLSQYDQDGIERIYGENRYETSASLARYIAKLTDIKSEAIMASGEDWADALTISPFATKNNIPILLSKKNEVPSETKAIIEELNIEKIYIAGGNSRISSDIEKDLPMVIDRFAGKDRYETAVLIAEKNFKNNTIYLASGESYSDSLVIGAMAGKNNSPILLTREKELPISVEKYLKNINIKEITVIGGNARISDDLVESLKK